MNGQLTTYITLMNILVGKGGRGEGKGIKVIPLFCIAHPYCA